MDIIPGLQYIPEFVDVDHEPLLLDFIDQQPWLRVLKRRVQHYGYWYVYRARAVDASMFLGPLPDWVLSLAVDLHSRGLFRHIPDQLIVNEYLPGQGISPHVDCEPCFGDTIASITLGSGCMMDFSRVDDGRKTSIYLQRRSIVILTREARYDWKHAIAPRKSDIREGQRVPRGRRVSLTFRNVLLYEATP